jgi:hypothetical protein
MFSGTKKDATVYGGGLPVMELIAGVNPGWLEGSSPPPPQILKWGSWRGVGSRGGCGFRSFTQ